MAEGRKAEDQLITSDDQLGSEDEQLIFGNTTIKSEKCVKDPILEAIGDFGLYQVRGNSEFKGPHFSCLYLKDLPNMFLSVVCLHCWVCLHDSSLLGFPQVSLYGLCSKNVDF